MLRIVKAFEPIQVTNITMCLYALPGVGRTSTGYTADEPILFDFDKASHRSKNRRGTTLLMDTWEDAQGVTEELLRQHKTVVVDTVGRLLDALTVTLIKQDAKNSNRAGGLSLQGYGALKTTFVGWLNQMRSYGLDVLLLSHCDEQKAGDDLIERLDIQGGSKNEVYKVCDAMGRIKIENRKRMLHFSPSDTAFGKNPAQLEPIEVPNYATTPDFLVGIMKTTKDAINKMSAEQAEVSGMLADWQAKVDAAETVEQFNGLMPEYKKVDPRTKDNAWRVVTKAAKAKGLTFEAAKGFVGAAAPRPEASPPANGAAKKAKGKKDDQPELPTTGGAEAAESGSNG